MRHLLLLLLFSFVNGDRIVNTNSGPVRGTFLDAKNVDAFLGIPYAEPPVGNLRFGKPIPKSPWTETLDAKEYSPACVQTRLKLHDIVFNESINIDEDCLYLNLWVPRTETTLKPVMVFIHGGGYMVGTASVNMYSGATLAQHGDVIVASINYRVGTLGFFSAFIDEAAGSIGMYDQVQAIQWIKENAKHFGGDPENIVIFGESAGAFSVSLHLVSPLSKNIFSRAILQSGTVINPMYSSDNAILRRSSQMVSKILGCAANDEDLKENPKNVLECMKNLPPEKFPEADEILVQNNAFLPPRVGDEFLPDNPTKMFRKGEFKDTEILLGVTRDEGSMFVALQLGYDDIFGEMVDPNTFSETMAKNITRVFMENEQTSKIVQGYMKRVEEESRYTYLNAVSDILGDSFLTCPTVFLADFHSLRNPTYFYVFDYRSPSSRFSEWMGVPHFEEAQYVFGNPLLKVFSNQEEELSEDMIDMWVTFAKTGNPSVPGGLKWPKYTYEDPKYLIIGMQDRVGVKPDNNRCEAWRRSYGATIDEEVIQNVK